MVKTVDFGAFVNFFGSKDGLVHISQLAKGRVAKTTDVVKEGDKVKVKLLGFDDRGKVRAVDAGRRSADRRRPRKAAGARGGGDGRVAKPDPEPTYCAAHHSAARRFASYKRGRISES